MQVSIIIPTLNEELTIGNLIDRLQVTLKEAGLCYEIIVVDDGSDDTSAGISQSRGARVYSLRTHMGKGYALRVGFAKARGEIVATMDSDGSHCPEELPQLLIPILKDQADLVIGSRFSPEISVPGKRLNAAGVRIFNILIRVLAGVEVSDSQSGFRAIKSVVLKDLDLNSEEYEIESEMLVKTVRQRFRVREVPISFNQRTYGVSRLDPLVDGFKIMLAILTSFLKG